MQEALDVLYEMKMLLAVVASGNDFFSVRHEGSSVAWQERRGLFSMDKEVALAFLHKKLNSSLRRKRVLHFQFRHCLGATRRAPSFPIEKDRSFIY